MGNDNSIYVLTHVTDGTLSPTDPLLGVYKSLGSAVRARDKVVTEMVADSTVWSKDSFIICNVHYLAIIFKDSPNRLHFWINKTSL